MSSGSRDLDTSDVVIENVYELTDWMFLSHQNCLCVAGRLYGEWAVFGPCFSKKHGLAHAKREVRILMRDNVRIQLRGPLSFNVLKAAYGMPTLPSTSPPYYWVGDKSEEAKDQLRVCEHEPLGMFVLRQMNMLVGFCCSMMMESHGHVVEAVNFEFAHIQAHLQSSVISYNTLRQRDSTCPFVRFMRSCFPHGNVRAASSSPPPRMIKQSSPILHSSPSPILTSTPIKSTTLHSTPKSPTLKRLNASKQASNTPKPPLLKKPSPPPRPIPKRASMRIQEKNKRAAQVIPD